MVLTLIELGVADPELAVAAPASEALVCVLQAEGGSTDSFTAWLKQLEEVLLADANSPTPYQTVLRVSDCITNPDRVRALSVAFPKVWDAFFHAARVALTSDALQFLNFVSVIEKFVVAEATVPHDLLRHITLQLSAPLDDPYVELARPALLYFVGSCCGNNPRILSHPAYSYPVDTTQPPSSINIPTEWCRALFDATLPCETVDLTQSVPEHLIAALESTFAVCASGSGLSLLLQWNYYDRVFNSLFRFLETTRQEPKLHALTAVANILKGYQKATPQDEHYTTLTTAFSKQRIQGFLWPCRTHPDCDVRVALWKALTAAVSAFSGAGLAPLILPLTVVYLTSGQNVESEALVRQQQLQFMSSAIKVIPSDSEVHAVMKRKFEVELHKGLYPSQGVRTDVLAGS